MRILLFPWYIFAFACNNGVILAFLGLLAGGLFFLRKRFLHVLLLLPALFFSEPGQARMPAMEKDSAETLFTWQKDAETSNFSFEVHNPKFEHITTEKCGDKTCYEQLYGKSNVFLNLRYEYYFLQIFGKWGAGVSAGSYSDSGSALNETNDGFVAAQERASLSLIPVTFYLSYKLDILTHSYVAPYVDLGYQHIFFSERAESKKFRGNRKGIFWSVGMLFNLDWLEQASVSRLHLFYGITNINFYAAFSSFSNSIGLDSLEGKRKNFDLGYQGWTFGFLFERE